MTLMSLFRKKEADPVVIRAVKESEVKARQTQELLAEIRARSASNPRLRRARIVYDERLHGNPS